ncbi:MAG: hypothetical protein ACNA77_11270, partial [Opitutales bacterium]
MFFHLSRLSYPPINYATSRPEIHDRNFQVDPPRPQASEDRPPPTTPPSRELVLQHGDGASPQLNS